MAPELVSVQAFSSGGDSQFGTEIDCTGFQVDDFLVIGLVTVVGGGGYIWYNTFSDDAGVTKYNKIAGPFGDSDSVFGYFDAGMVNGGIGTNLLRHKVKASDLVDAGVGNHGTLRAFGWRKGAASGAYGAALVCWQMRGVTYASSAVDADSDAAPVSPDPRTLSLTGSVLTAYQAWFSLGMSHGNGYAPPATFVHTAADDKTGPHFGPLTAAHDWSYAGATANNGFAYSANRAFGTLDDLTNVDFTLGVGGDTTANVDSCMAIVTFVEPIPQPVVTSSKVQLPLRMKVTELPVSLNRGMIRG